MNELKIYVKPTETFREGPLITNTAKYTLLKLGTVLTT